MILSNTNIVIVKIKQELTQIASKISNAKCSTIGNDELTEALSEYIAVVHELGAAIRQNFNLGIPNMLWFN